jgi:biotin synthase-like enzyme
MAGNLPDSDAEWEYMLELSGILNDVKPLNDVDSYLNILPPLDKQYLYKAEALGFRKMIFNLEVFGEKFFRAVCPGKNMHIPYAVFLQRMREAAEIFGAGMVRCGFVLGAQPAEYLKEGVIELAEQGIVSDFTVFTPKKGTPWEHKKRPDIFEVADISSFLREIYEKYNFSPLYCSLSSRSGIMNELMRG